MKTFKIAIKQPKGTFGSKCETKAKSLKEYVARDDVQKNIIQLMANKQVWKIMEVFPNINKDTSVTRYTPRS